MAKQFAIKFYQSKSWISVRDYVMARCYGICEKCHTRPAEIVHHIIWLNADNINDPDISLNPYRLIGVCRECHAIIHEGVSSTKDELLFDSEGNLIRR